MEIQFQFFLFQGYKSRQPLYSCKTCFAETGQQAGICYGCSENCHEGHDLVEMYTKRNFSCDCGNSKFKTKCKLFEVLKTFKFTKIKQNFTGQRPSEWPKPLQ